MDLIGKMLQKRSLMSLASQALQGCVDLQDRVFVLEKERDEKGLLIQKMVNDLAEVSGLDLGHHPMNHVKEVCERARLNRTEESQ